MGKRVAIIASGETERRSLPHLLSHLCIEGIDVIEVRIPPGHRALNMEMADRLIKATWYERISAPPDKFVILVDIDGKDPNDVLDPFRKELPARIAPKINASLQFAYAQWHLEAWYFADGMGLRQYFDGSNLGSVDTSAPDQIQNPKLHLKHLLGQRAYTAVVSEEIAKALKADRISQRSASFQGFLKAVRNGASIEC